jgi:hypothetical protein
MAQLTTQHLLSEQKRIAQLAFEDEDNQRLMILALAAGMISSMALGRLYSKLTPETDDNNLMPVAKAGLIAIGSGMLMILYKANSAQYQP